jgi:molybdopterin molybdotransferase
MNKALLSVEEAQAQLLAQVKTISATEYVSLAEASGRVLAMNITSEVDVPSADVSMMDGYALNHEQIQPAQGYPVSLRIPAGQLNPAPLSDNSLARIFTGAVLPEGATAVVMQEEAEIQADGLVLLSHRVQAGQMIRRQGSDIALGQQVLSAGKRVSPADVGLCASIGQSLLLVREPLSIALITTGDELVAPDQPLQKGQSYNSNQSLIRAFLQEQGYVVKTFHCPDDRSATIAVFSEAVEQCDVVISTGGVSVGEEDHVRAVVSALGHIDAWKVRMKPGKPFAFGRLQGKPFLGLPGNPVAAFTTFHLFVLPTLAKLQGLTYVMPQAMPVIAHFSFKSGDRREYLRARLLHQAQGLTAEIYPNQASSALISTSWAEGFVIVPEHHEIAMDDTVRFVSFSAFRQ